MNGMKVFSMNHKRSASVSLLACDVCSHEGKRSNDPVHGTGTDRVVSVKSGRKILTCQDSGDQSGGGSAVTYIKNFCWGDQSVETFSPHKDFLFGVFNFNSHFAEAGNCRKAVGAFQKVRDFCGSFCESAEHDCPVGNGFISGNSKCSPKTCLFFDFHIITYRSYTI